MRRPLPGNVAHCRIAAGHHELATKAAASDIGILRPRDWHISCLAWHSAMILSRPSDDAWRGGEWFPACSTASFYFQFFFPKYVVFRCDSCYKSFTSRKYSCSKKKKAFQLPFHWAILLLERYGIGPLFLFLLGRAAVSSQRGPPRFLSSL